MLIILYLASAASFLLYVILSIADNVLIRKKDIPKEKRYAYIKRRFFRKLLICIVFMFVLVQGIPWTVWKFSPKEEHVKEKITVKNSIYPLQDVEGTYYLGILTDSNGKQKYAVNTLADGGISQQILDPKSLEVVNANAGEKPLYEKVVQYKQVKLKTDKYKLLRDSVNNVYGYISGYKEIKLNEKVKLIIPKGTTMDDYGTKDFGK